MIPDPSPRVFGVIIVCVGALLIGLSVVSVLRSGEFYVLASILGPTGAAYGLSIILRPPPMMPQTEFGLIHKVLTGVGCCLGLIFFLLLKFVDLRSLFDR